MNFKHQLVNGKDGAQAFLLAIFLHFSLQFSKVGVKFCVHFSTFLNFEKRVLQKCLRITFYIYITRDYSSIISVYNCEPLSFSKKT
jgi:hypothetical protein